MVRDVQQACGPGGRGVMEPTGQWVRDPRQAASQGAGDLDVEARGLVSARIQIRPVLPGLARQERAINDEPGGGIQVLHHRHVRLKGLGDHGRPGRDDARSGGPGHPGHGGRQSLEQVEAQEHQDRVHAPVRPRDERSRHRRIHRIGTDGLADIEDELAR